MLLLTITFVYKIGADSIAEEGPRSIGGTYEVNFTGWPSMGDVYAPIVMVEYSDFTCPFCISFWENTFPEIKEKYIDTGKVRFVHKNFIIGMGVEAAEAAYCAAEQGAFWEYHNLLMERSSLDIEIWPETSVHRRYANGLGINADKLIDCLEKRRYRDMVAVSNMEALTAGMEGTPTFVINGIFIPGAEPFSVFEEIFEKILFEHYL